MIEEMNAKQGNVPNTREEELRQNTFKLEQGT